MRQIEKVMEMTMKLEDEDGRPLATRDVYEKLIGKQVVVYTPSSFAISGTLKEWNGFILSVEKEGVGTTYVHFSSIVGILELA